MREVPSSVEDIMHHPGPEKAISRRAQQIHAGRPDITCDEDLERLLLHHIRPQVCHTLDPLQFVYQDRVGVEDAIVYMLHQSLSLTWREAAIPWELNFWTFFSTLNTI